VVLTLGKRRATIKVGVQSNHEDLIRGFSRIDRNLTQAAFEGTQDATERLVGAIRSGIPFSNPDPLGRAGRTVDDREHARNTWGHMVERTPKGGRGIASSDNFISYLYWHGVQEHPIVATRKKLRFFWRGHERFFANVLHPGFRPHPFIEEAGQRVEAFLKEDFDRPVSRVFDAEDGRV
jgi:hypothetical protein